MEDPEQKNHVFDPFFKLFKRIAAKIRSLKDNLTSESSHFNFLPAHYAWIVSMTILGSVVLYGAADGKLAYIDALFFSSGSNTQAGLNTVDLNTLTTFQQVVLYLLPLATNPITIHSSVVFLRLYWFEKHFQQLVREARARRSTISKSRSRAKNDLSAAENGSVDPRDVNVTKESKGQTVNDGSILRGGAAPASGGMDGVADEDPVSPTAPTGNGNALMKHSNETDSTKVSGSDESSKSPGESPGESAVTPQPERADQSNQAAISFADTVKRSDGQNDQQTRFEKRTPDQHLAIHERQRNLNDNDGEVLRIPNPRDAEMGIGPRALQSDDVRDLEDEQNEQTKERDFGVTPTHIVIQEPVKPTGGERTQSAASDAAGPSDTPRLGPGQLFRRMSTFAMSTFAPPRRRKRDELADDARAIGNTFAPRMFGANEAKHNLDADSNGPPRPTRSRTFMDIKTSLGRDKGKDNDMPYLSWTPTEMGRNSQFYGLSLEQREELGGIEYRSLRTLALLLVCYFLWWHTFAVICLLPFIHAQQKYGQVVDDAGVSRTWWSFYTANSAFNDVGFTLTPDSMISFADSPYILVIMSFLILIGNSAFPLMLRFSIWCISKVVPRGSGLWEELRFLLDHPRRCFTLLFPSATNWWLFWAVIVMNGIDIILFIVLDLQTNALENFDVGQQISNGLFLAASTRTAGFASVNLNNLHPAVQTSYMIMMYISVFPIAISIRRTNVYEEKSLGISEAADEEEGNENSTVSYIGNHLRRQLSFDLWYVFGGLFILAISEGGRIMAGDFNLFAILFEAVSAYGTVGLSLGYPTVNASLSSQFTTVGKLVIIAMQIRGRHRGLPYGLDRAIMLPSQERLHEAAELPDLARTNTGVSTGTGLTRLTTGLQRRNTAGGSALARKSSGFPTQALTRRVTGLLIPGPPPPPQQRGRANSRSLEPRPSPWDEEEGADDADGARLGPAVTNGTVRTARTTIRRGSGAGGGTGLMG